MSRRSRKNTGSQMLLPLDTVAPLGPPIPHGTVVWFTLMGFGGPETLQGVTVPFLDFQGKEYYIRGCVNIRYNRPTPAFIQLRTEKLSRNSPTHASLS